MRFSRSTITACTTRGCSSSARNATSSGCRSTSCTTRVSTRGSAAPSTASCPSCANGYAVWFESQRLVAKARWRNENAQAGSPTNTDAIEQVVSTYEQMDAEQIAAGFPDGIKSLRWGLQHVDFATPTHLARLKALNCAVSMSGFRWLGG